MVSANARVRRRGIHENIGLNLTTRFPFGLFRRRSRRQVDVSLIVTPGRRRIRSLKVRTPASRGSLRASRPGEGFELFNIRDYTTQDDARRIDWKASARLHRPMLKEFEREQERALEIVVDERSAPSSGSRTGSEDEAFERLLETAASILDHCEETGIRGRLLVPRDGAFHEALEGRSAMIYLAGARMRADAPDPGPREEPVAGIPRIVLSLNPSARTQIHVEWAEAREDP
jgi:uncharacterized protein (DUF58 family)